MKSLIPWRTGDNFLDRFRKEMGSVFGRYFGPMEEEEMALETWSPRVDIEETEGELVVTADLPGVDPEGIEVNVSDGYLELRGEKKEEREAKEKNYLHTERFVGKFYRRFPLPSGCDPDKISAESSKGVVTIHLPKSPEAQPKKIAVKANN